MKRNKNSILLTAVPLERGGQAIHYEHSDDTALTNWNADETETVKEIHTPQLTLQRIHEVLHARHTTPSHNRKHYANVNDDVRNIIEDCRMHVLFWPWDTCRTPESIDVECMKAVQQEISLANKAAAKQKETHKHDDDFGIFVTRLRADAVHLGLRGKYKVKWPNATERIFAREILYHIVNGNIKKAAEMLQEVFFGENDLPEITMEHGVGDFFTINGSSVEKIPVKRGKVLPGKGGEGKPPMEIIELPHTTKINDEKDGKRIGTSGMRLYRPALRRPELTARLFVRRARKIPGGTILVDASGSMGDWSVISKWCETAPTATLAYYAGAGNRGQLIIYARDGYRCDHFVQPCGGGNDVDGYALDWLMKQDGPRLFITDREFCGAYDADMQKMRLRRLEALGEVTVKHYRED